MAENDSSSEKTEDATPRRVRDAREKGQVAKSRDLNTIMILISAVVAFAFLTTYMSTQLQQSMTDAFRIASAKSIDNRVLLQHITSAAIAIAKTLIPFLAIIVFVAVTVGFLQVGAIFTFETIKMEAKRLNIVENVKNMCKVTTLIELIKNAAKLGVIFLIAYLVVKHRIGNILRTMFDGPVGASLVARDVLVAFLIWVFVLFLIIAAIDIFVQRWQHAKQLRMTKDEVKREYKQDEGDPQIKSQRRQLHQEMAMSDTKKAVSASDMVVTNPTHLAVAIKYNDKEMMAPQIMAKGQRLYAQMIRELAEEAGIPVMQNVPLAWALIELEVGDEVPESLYKAVAELLLIVYKMKQEGHS